MKLKRKLSQEEYDKLAPHYQELYAEGSDGEGYKFVGAEDDPDSKAKLDEFRSNNRNLKKDVDRLTPLAKALEDSGLTIEELANAKEAMEARRQKEEGELIEKGEIDEVVARRLKEASVKHDRELTAAKAATAEAKKTIEVMRGELNKSVLHTQLLAPFDGAESVARIRKGARTDILNRVEKEWRINDEGRIEPWDAESGKVRMVEDEADTPMAWAERLREGSDYLFEASEGGGSGNQNSGGGPRSTIGGKKVLSNPTADEFGANIESIASGKMEVRY